MKKFILAALVAATGGLEVQTTAKVARVSKLTGTVTLRGADGEKMKLRLPRETRNLDQIKPGAMLTVRYSQAAAVAIGKTGAVPSQVVEHNRFVMGRIEDVDVEKRVLKVKGPDDETIRLHVAPDVSGFEDARIGDTAAIRFKEAVALSFTRHNWQN